MILRRLRVKGWKCFGDLFELGPFSEGITLVSGPNGSGKSSLFWALARGLFDRHGTGGREMERFRSWDRELSPEVTVDFEVGGEAWRVEKTFLAGAACSLSRLDGEQTSAYAEGDAADEHLRRLLGFPGATRGLSKPEHWGLAQLLWTPQGALEIPVLGAETLGVIRQSLGGQLAAGSRIGGAIEGEFLRYCSPTGRELRGDRAPAVVALREARGDQQVRRAALDLQLLEFEELQQALDDSRARGELLRREANAEQGNLEKEEARVQEYQDLDAATRLEAKSAEAAGGRFQALDERIRRLALHAGRMAASEGEIPALREAQAATRRAMEESMGAETAARDALETLRARSEEVQRQRERAAAARDLRDARREVDDATKRLDGYRTRLAELGQHRDARNGLLAPAPEDLEAIRGLQARIREDRVRLEAALVTLEVVPDRDTAAEVLAGDEPGPRDLAGGSPGIVRGAPSVEVRLEGFGVIRARGPVGDTETLRRDLDAAAADLSQRTRRFGTGDVEELARRAARATRLDDIIQAAEVAKNRLLDGGDADSLAQSVATGSEQIRSVLEMFPEWDEAPPDVDGSEQEARRLQEAWVQEVREAEGALDLARARTSAAKEDLDRAEGTLSSMERRLDQDREELVELRQTDGFDDGERARLRDREALDHRAALASLTEARERLAAFGEDPTPARDRLREKVRTYHEGLREREIRINTLQVQLAGMVGSRSPQLELARAEEKIAELDARILREERRMGAVQLLRRLIQEEEQRRMDGLVAPVERDASELLRRISGPRLGDLLVGEGLQPAHIRPRAVREGVEPGIDDLSVGEREQVHFAVRLALAGILVREERQLVVLDDILAYTDLGRYNHVLGILEELSERLQIVILSCHPERYGSLIDVRFDLETLRG
ncbi:MAG: AAA family ATPase [Pseudomonadota bacterium]